MVSESLIKVTWTLSHEKFYKECNDYLPFTYKQSVLIGSTYKVIVS